MNALVAEGRVEAPIGAKACTLWMATKTKRETQRFILSTVLVVPFGKHYERRKIANQSARRKKNDDAWIFVLDPIQEFGFRSIFSGRALGRDGTNENFAHFVVSKDSHHHHHHHHHLAAMLPFQLAKPSRGDTWNLLGGYVYKALTGGLPTWPLKTWTHHDSLLFWDLGCPSREK